MAQANPMSVALDQTMMLYADFTSKPHLELAPGSTERAGLALRLIGWPGDLERVEVSPNLTNAKGSFERSAPGA